MTMRRITAPPQHERCRRTLTGAALAAAALALVAGCGGGSAEVSGATSAPVAPAADQVAEATTTTVAVPADAVGAPVPSDAVSQVARAASDLAVYAAPGGTETAVLTATTEFGSPRALLVVAEDGDWLQVALPVRPNGSTGWIGRADVDVRAIDESIVIDLAARTLTLLDGGTAVLTTPVAIGASDNPTPTGDFYVVDKVDTGDPTGPYGQFAFGLSAHSDVVTEFAGGDGQVGIHGTNDPSSIGQAVSHGCIRVPADVARQLSDTINLGTPVAIS